VFGAFATLLLLRTGSLAAPVAAHVFCNAQGFPDFPRMLQHSRGARAALASGVVAFVCAMSHFCATAAWRMAP
jgi:prenyl protein peptidase